MGCIRCNEHIRCRLSLSLKLALSDATCFTTTPHVQYWSRFKTSHRTFPRKSPRLVRSDLYARLEPGAVDPSSAHELQTTLHILHILFAFQLSAPIPPAAFIDFTQASRFPPSVFICHINISHLCSLPSPKTFNSLSRRNNMSLHHTGSISLICHLAKHHISQVGLVSK